MRHYAVSCLIEQGAPILVVAKIAGHADPSITLRVYAHLLERRARRGGRPLRPAHPLAWHPRGISEASG